MNSETSGLMHRKAAFIRVTAISAAILLIPLIAMQFTEEVGWGAADFIVMGSFLLAMGSMFVLISRRVPWRRRIVLAAVLVALFLYLWVELAVGIFTNLGS